MPRHPFVVTFFPAKILNFRPKVASLMPRGENKISTPRHMWSRRVRILQQVLSTTRQMEEMHNF